MRSTYDLSIVIPIFNRGELVRHTLNSVRDAAKTLSVEVVVVDDGSAVPVADDLTRLNLSVDQVIRQSNRGLLFARLAGLDAARGRSVVFLDSDDLVSRDKLRAHIDAHQDRSVDVSYTDTAHQVIHFEQGPQGEPIRESTSSDTQDAAEFFITVQPAPHSPAFRTEYLRQRVAHAPFPPSSLYNAVAEIWFYHICAPFPAKVVKCPGLAIVGTHSGERLTNHWERLGVASLAVQEAFVRTCPATPNGNRAHTLLAAKAFNAWRRLPRGFSTEFATRSLNLYRSAPTRPPITQLGGGLFQKLARVVGPVTTGHLFRRLQNRPYATCQTLSEGDLAHLLAQLPSP
jgi:glycosyltransferase involved in cell wall biosynthesis